jgi:hypothetical protein
MCSLKFFVDVKRSRQCISGNLDNFTVSISFEYELERLVAVYMKQDYAKRRLGP